MEFRQKALNLLRLEREMVNVNAIRPEKVDPIKKETTIAVSSVIGAIVARLLRSVVENKMLMLQESQGYLRLIFWGCFDFLRRIAFAAGVALGAVYLLLVCVTLIRTGQARARNKALEKRKAAAREAYDRELAAVRAEKANHPEYAGKHFFFDDAHPFDPESPRILTGHKVEKVLRSTLTFTITSGELNLWKPLMLGDGSRWRVDDFHNEKYATYEEVLALMEKCDYACPLWQEDYMRAHAKDQCRILTLHHVSNHGVYLETKKVTDASVDSWLDRYYSAMDPLGRFVSAGIADRKNTSDVIDNRQKDANAEFEKFYETVRGSSLLSTESGARFGSGVLSIQKLGYLILDCDMENTVRGFAFPNFHERGLTVSFSHDLFSDEDNADTVFRGWVVDVLVTSPSSKLPCDTPDYATALACAADNKRLTWPAIDVLEEKRPGVSEAQWHHFLRWYVKYL